jgi:hypothetical protein
LQKSERHSGRATFEFKERAARINLPYLSFILHQYCAGRPKISFCNKIPSETDVSDTMLRGNIIIVQWETVLYSGYPCACGPGASGFRACPQPGLAAVRDREGPDYHGRGRVYH